MVPPLAVGDRPEGALPGTRRHRRRRGGAAAGASRRRSDGGGGGGRSLPLLAVALLGLAVAASLLAAGGLLGAPDAAWLLAAGRPAARPTVGPWPRRAAAVASPELRPPPTASPADGAPPAADGTGETPGGPPAAVRFDDLAISEETKRALRETLELDECTVVQRQSLPLLLEGQDAVIRANTGTGKTLTFMIPVVERVKENPWEPGGPIFAVVLAPGRELCMQTVAVAEDLLSAHNEVGGPRVFLMGGQKDVFYERQDLAEQQTEIVVSTPGRFLDHVQNMRGFDERLGYVEVLVLDEADRLLSEYPEEMERILEALPPLSERQTILASATLPTGVAGWAGLAFKEDYAMSDMTHHGEGETPVNIMQKYAVIPQEGMANALWGLLQKYMHDETNPKVMVFFTTTRMAQYYADWFAREGQMSIQITQMNAKSAQSKRTSAAHAFWTGDTGVMFSTDISARGMDYPNVTTVVHFGAPISATDYVHRVGRCGRMGREGESILLLHDFETDFLDKIAGLGELEQVQVQELTGGHHREVFGRKARPLPSDQVRRVYQAWLGHYKTVYEGIMPPAQVVKLTNGFAASIGALDRHGRPPAIKESIVKKMGLSGVPGLNTVRNWREYLQRQSLMGNSEDRGDSDDDDDDSDSGRGSQALRARRSAPPLSPFGGRGGNLRGATAGRGLRPVAGDALTEEGAQKYLPRTPEASIKIFFGKAWKANYEGAIDGSRSRIRRWSDRPGQDKRSALLEALAWVWHMHEEAGGETCPWDLSA